jgi:hypothetical protein
VNNARERAELATTARAKRATTNYGSCRIRIAGNKLYSRRGFIAGSFLGGYGMGNRPTHHGGEGNP